QGAAPRPRRLPGRPPMREARRPRRWEIRAEEDPLAGLVNLFDLWMVFSIALLIVFAGAIKKRAEAEPRPIATPEARSLDRYRISHDALNSTGERLGTAYRLPSGE